MTTLPDIRASQLDPHVLEFLKGLEAQGGAPLYTLTPAQARDVLVKTQRTVNVNKLPAEIEDRIIEGGPTGQVPVRIIRPQGVKGALPGVLYIHGGGWVMGDKEVFDRLTREIANGAQATVIFVDYTRSPEAKYPIAIEQAYTVAKWVAEHGAEIGVDPTRLAVVGDSVGGNMSAALTMLAKQRGGPKLICQVLFYPVTDGTNFDTPSYREFGANGYWLTREAMKWFWDNYTSSNGRNEPTVSPLLATTDQLKGLPPALVITDENDVLRDEGEAYAHKLIAAGVPVIATRYEGIIHDFVMLNAIAETPATRAAIAQATATLRQIFTQR
jgi:acetyl esterase